MCFFFSKKKRDSSSSHDKFTRDNKSEKITKTTIHLNETKLDELKPLIDHISINHDEVSGNFNVMLKVKDSKILYKFLETHSGSKKTEYNYSNLSIDFTFDKIGNAKIFLGKIVDMFYLKQDGDTCLSSSALDRSTAATERLLQHFGLELPQSVPTAPSMR